MEQDQQKTLGDLIRQGRKDKEWTQDDLAEHIGVSPMQVRRWEHNLSHPRLYTLNKLKKLFAIQDEMIVRLPKISMKGVKGETTQAVEIEVEERDIEITFPPQASTDGTQEKPTKEREADTEEYEVEIAILPRKVYRGIITEKRWVDNPFSYQGWSCKKHVLVDDGDLPFHEPLRPGDAVDAHVDRGRNGQGPRNLAVSILKDYFLSALPVQEKHLANELAWKYSAAFKEDFVWWFPQHEGWELWSGAITAWLQEQQARQAVVHEGPDDMWEQIEHGWCGWSEKWDTYKGT